MSIAATENCLFYIDERGSLLHVGHISQNQIATSDAPKKRCVYKHMHIHKYDSDNNELPQFNYIQAGLRHALAIDISGALWFIGYTRHGVAGIDESTLENKFCFVPMRVPMAPFQHAKVLLTACGTNHSLILTTLGVFASGKSNFGETGCLTIESLREFTPVIYGKCSNAELVLDSEDQPIYQIFPMLKKIVSIAAGANHSLILNDAGEVWSAGSGSYGRLGNGLDGHDNLVFCQVDPTYFDNLHVEAIACGGTHSLFLVHGSVFACGDNCTVITHKITYIIHFLVAACKCVH